MAKYLDEYLKQENMENTEAKKLEKIYLTKPEKEFKNIAKNIMKVDMEIEEIN